MLEFYNLYHSRSRMAHHFILSLMKKDVVWPALNKSLLKGANQLKAGVVGIRNECGIVDNHHAITFDN